MSDDMEDSADAVGGVQPGSRVPPHDNDAEVATLGALLFNYSSELSDEAAFFLHAEDFYRPAHQVIYKAIQDLSSRGASVDILTLTDELRSRSMLDRAGGAAYVASLTAHVPTASNLDYYAEIVRQNSVRRQLLSVASTISSEAHNASSSTRTIMESTERRLLEIGEAQEHSREFQEASQVIHETINVIDARSRNKSGNPYTGIPSGIRDLDSKTMGFQNSEMIIIGARPSVGKTAFALSLAAHAAVREKMPCGFFTLEMTALSLMHRIISAEAHVDSNKIRSGVSLTKEDWGNLVNAAERISEAPLYIDDTPNIQLIDLRTRARRMVRKKGVKIIFIDYLGLITTEDRSMARHEQMSDISMTIKALARELDIPIVTLSQVGRQAEDKAPGMADLRGSGALEQDADMVLYLHRDRHIKEEEEVPETIETFLHIAKQRNGPVGVVKLLFLPRFTQFTAYSDYE